MESYRSASRSISCSVSSQNLKLSSVHASPVRVYEVKYPRFAVSLERSNLFLTKYSQAIFPGICRDESQLEKSARISMSEKTPSYQSLTHRPRQQTWQFGDASAFSANYRHPIRPFVSYGGQKPPSLPNISLVAAEPDRKEVSSQKPGCSFAQEPSTSTSSNDEIPTKTETKNMAPFNKDLQGNKWEINTGNEATMRSNVKLNTTRRSGDYWERRKRNNLSAKRSRDVRRLRELQTQRRVTFLEEENMRIRAELRALEEENHRFKRILSGHV